MMYNTNTFIWGVLNKDISNLKRFLKSFIRLIL